MLIGGIPFQTISDVSALAEIVQALKDGGTSELLVDLGNQAKEISKKTQELDQREAEITSREAEVAKREGQIQPTEARQTNRKQELMALGRELRTREVQVVKAETAAQQLEIDTEAACELKRREAEILVEDAKKRAENARALEAQAEQKLQEIDARLQKIREAATG